MRTVRISEISLKQKNAAELTFREKLELAKLLGRLGLDVIEMPALGEGKGDALLVKSIAQALSDTVIALPSGLEEESIKKAFDALKDAKKPRLQVVCPVSSVQMEYLLHEKSTAVVAKLVSAIKLCKSLCNDVEFVADDATRSEKAFLYEVISAAVEAGATLVSVSDNAGNMLPSEYEKFIAGIFENVPGLKNAGLGVCCCNKLALADVCSMSGAAMGAVEIKASTHPKDAASVSNLTKIIGVKGQDLGISCNIKTVEIKRIIGQIERIFTETKNKNTPFEDGVREEDEKLFTINDTEETIALEVRRLGYDLSDEDNERVYETFKSIAEKKESVTAKELDAMVASSALQVPPTYKVENYVINTGNVITATAHMKMYKGEKMLESVSVGDGPIDAAFLAIEQITGHHYELDDFQIRAVTQGRTAMGETIVKLRAGGKVYSGRGLSTDIVASGIFAYVNALNKIVYEEENA